MRAKAVGSISAEGGCAGGRRVLRRMSAIPVSVSIRVIIFRSCRGRSRRSCRSAGCSGRLRTCRLGGCRRGFGVSVMVPVAALAQEHADERDCGQRYRLFHASFTSAIPWGISAKAAGIPSGAQAPFDFARLDVRAKARTFQNIGLCRGSPGGNWDIYTVHGSCQKSAKIRKTVPRRRDGSAPAEKGGCRGLSGGICFAPREPRAGRVRMMEARPRDEIR